MCGGGGGGGGGRTSKMNSLVADKIFTQYSLCNTQDH